MTTPTPLTRTERHDQWAARRRLIAFTDVSRLSDDTRAATRQTARRITTALASLTDAFRDLGAAFEAAGWTTLTGREHDR